MKTHLRNSFMLFAFLMLGYYAFAQVQTGSSSSQIGFRTGYNVPIYTNDYTKTQGYSQTIYYAEDIKTSGTITQLRWECADSDLSNADNWDIYIGHTTKREFSYAGDWIPLSELTQVFSGTVSIASTPFATTNGDRYAVTADITDFTYNGIGNLVIAVNEKGTGSNSIDDFYCSVDYNGAARSMIGYNNDATIPIDPAIPPHGSRSITYDAMPRLTLYGLNVTCVQPSTISASALYNEATINWNESTGSSWNVIISEEPLLTTSGKTPVTVTNGSYNATGLKMGTDYHAYIQNDCGASQSAWIEKVFTTNCGTLSSFPYTQNFDGSNYPPNCWTTLYGGGNPENGTLMQYTEDEFRSSPQSFRFSYQSSVGQFDEFLISPNLDPTTPKVISFWYKQSAGGDETFAVGTAANTYTNISNYTWGNDVSDANNTWQQYSMFMEPGVRSVAIKYDYLNQEYLYIDDLTISEAAVCTQPTNLNATNILHNSATINWTAGSSETIWNVIVSENEVTDFASASKAQVTNNSYAATGLNSSSNYYIYVQAQCNDLSRSQWTESTFSTTCTTFSAPFPENFENGGDMPSCWKTYGNEEWLFSQTAGEAAADHTSGSGYYAYINDYYPHSSNINLETRPIDISGLSTPGLLFYAYSDNNGHAGANTTLYVDIWDGTWHNNAYTHNGNTNGWQQMYVPLDSYNSTIKVRFRANETSSSYDNLCIDDISIDDVPNCSPVSNITYSNVHHNRANIDWNAGGSESAWNFIISEIPVTNFAAATQSICNSSDKYVSSLDAGTNYYVYVQSDCGAIDGMWISSTFSTTSPGISNLAASNITAHTAELNWTASGYENSNWEVVLSKTEINDFSTVTPVQVSSKPYTASGLSLASNYHAYVRAVYNDVPSDWSTINFTTDCGVIADYPLEQSFEETFYTLAPNCWTAYKNDYSNSAMGRNTSASYVRSGNQSFKFESVEMYSYLSYDQYLITPELYTGRIREISFWHRKASSFNSPRFSIGVSTTGNNHSSDFTWSTLITNSTTNWQKFTYEFDSNVKYVCIKFDPESGNSGYFYIDDLSISEKEIAPVSNLTVDAINPTSATLSWNAGATESNWNIIISETKVTDFDAASKTPLTSSFYNATGLSTYTDYYCYVQSNMGGANVSEWTEITFSTPCSAVSSVNENFGTSASTPPVNCWKTVRAETISNNKLYHSSGGRTGYAFRFMSSLTNDGPYDQYLITPFLNLSSAAKVAFWYKNLYYTNPETFAVGYSTSTSNIEDFIWGNDMESTDKNNWTEYETYIPTEAKFVAIHYKSVNQKYLLIDDFTVSAVTGCTPVTNLSLINTSAYSADIAWTDISGSSNWNFVISESELADPSTGNIQALTATNISIANLEPGTDYYCYVQTDCGGSTSEWKNINFTSACGPITNYPFEPIFAAAKTATCWTVEYSELASLSNNCYFSDRNFSFYSGNVADDFNAWVVSPEFNFNGGIKELTFEAQKDLTSQETFAVGISITGNDINNDFNWQPDIVVETSNNPVNYILELDPEVKYVAIHSKNAERSGKLYIKNFKIGYVTPKNITVSNIKANQADINWEGGDASITWNYILSTTQISDFSSVSYESVNTKSVQYSNLTESTTYYFYVQNSLNTQTTGWEETSFSTPCSDLNVFPVVEDFEDSDFFNRCWSTYYSNASHQDDISIYLESLRFRQYYDDYSDQAIISPPLEITSEKQLSFIYNTQASMASYRAYFKVGFSSTSNDIDNFTWEDMVFSSPSAYEEYVTTVPVSTKYVAIYFKQYTNNINLFIDNFRIANQLTGSASINHDGTPQFDETLEAELVGSNNSGNLSYTWYRGSSQISGAHNATYTLTASDIGKTISVEITSDAEIGTLLSDATAAVTKADGPAAPPTPSYTSKSKTSITLTSTTGYEYRKNTDDWQSTYGFYGLTQGTEYSFTQRIKETSTHLPSAVSEATVITTEADALTGTVTISGLTKFDETLTANVSNTNNHGTLYYQWKRDGVDIVGATEATYTLIEEDINKIMRVVVSSSIQIGAIWSNNTTAISKADGPEAPLAPSLSSKTETSITLANTNGYEYRRGTESWQDSYTFSSLSANTTYSFTQRVKETNTHYASATSDASNITTEAENLAGTVSINGSAVYGQELTAITTSITNNTGDFIYQWKRDNVDISGATSATYTLTIDDIDTEISVVVSSTVEQGSVSSTATATVIKASPAKPVAPTIASKTSSSITLTSVAGAEYSFDDGSNWQISNVFTGLSQGTAYTFVQRMLETTTHFASESSEGKTEYTDGDPLAGIVAISGTATYNEELIADVSEINNNTGILSYQWLRNGTNIEGETTATYTLAADDIGALISVEVRSSIQSGSVTSAETSIVTKADAPSAPSAPEMASATTTSITLTAVAGGEYSIDNGTTWQSSSSFSDLSQGMEYSFIQRIAESATHYESINSESADFWTEAEDLAGTISITDDGTPQFGETLTANITGITNNTGTLEFIWKRNEVTIIGAFEATYTLVEADIDANIKVEVFSSVQGASIISEATAAIDKADNPEVPVDPVIASFTANEIILSQVNAYEYAIDGLFGDDRVFNGLTQLTEYTFTQRIKETATHKASVVSNEVTQTTDAEILEGTVTISDDASPQFGETISSSVTLTNNTGSINYQWYHEDGSAITGANSSSYTLTVDDIGNKLYLSVSSSDQYGAIESDLSNSVTKADQAAPLAPLAANVTYNSISLTAVDGCEYAIDGSAYQTATEFSALTQLTTYVLTQRLAETDTHHASPASDELNITTLAAPLSGTVSVVGTTKFGELLSADVTGITNNTGTLSFQWKRDDSNIEGATAATYTIAEADIETTIKVEVSSNVQTGSLLSEATSVVTKADNLDIPDEPVLSSKTYNSITLLATNGYEYSIDNGSNWQASATFTNLADETSYELIQRIAETNTHFASASSNALAVTTEVKPANALDGIVTISGILQYNQELTATVSDHNNTGTLHYQWKRNGISISEATEATYVLGLSDIGTNISVEVSSSVEIGSISSQETAFIEKADQNAPEAPILLARTIHSISLVEQAGYEYSMDNISWSSSGEFTGLLAYNSYELFQRLIPTATHKVSPASNALLVTTLANMLEGVAAITSDGTPQFGEILTASLSDNNNTGDLTYQWIRNDQIIESATYATYTLKLEDIGSSLRVNIGSTIERGEITSAATAIIQKANQLAPNAPVAESITSNGITLETVSGAEYFMEGGNWQSEPVFDELIPNTSYGFSQRLAETASHYASSTSETTLITTLKESLEGSISILVTGTPQYGKELSVDVSGISNNTGTLSYQWQRNYEDIANETNAMYTIAAADIANTLSVLVTSSEQSGSLSATISGIEKADADTPVNPVLSEKTSNSISLIAVAGYEYTMDQTNWQSESEFTSLNANTAYNCYQRIAETETHHASEISEVLTITTDKLALEGTIAINSDGTPQFGEALSVDISGITNHTGILSYQWQRNAVDISGETNAIYTITAADIANTISVVLSSSDQSGTLSAEITGITKADAGAALNPQLAEKTTNSVSLVSLDGYEYSMDQNFWQQAAVFTELNASTAYDFYQRIAETETHQSSEISEKLTVTTDTLALTGTVIINSDGTPQYGEELSVEISNHNNTGNFNYQWIRGTSAIENANNETYTLSVEDINQSISVIVSSTIELGNLESEGTALIEKADQVAPQSPVLVAKTDSSVTLEANAGFEYAIINNQWQNNELFIGLQESTTYEFTQRLAETLTHKASPASESLSVTTNSSAPVGYNVTFNIASENKGLLASVVFNNVAYTTDENGYLLIPDVLPGSYAYEVSALGYLTFSDNLTIIDAPVEQNVMLQLEPVELYTLTFRISDNSSSNAIEGASVNLIGYGELYSDTNGEVVFDSIVPDINLNYLITADGYEQVNGTIETTNANVIEEVAMTPVIVTSYTVTFVVSDGSTAIADALVNLSGYGELLTNSNGEAIFENVLPASEIPYTISAENYIQMDSALTVTNADVTENVNLKLFDGITDHLPLSFTCYPNPVESLLTVAFNDKFTGQVILGNAQGRSLFIEKPVDVNAIQLDMKDLCQGVYYVAIIKNDVQIVKKVVKF